MRIRRYFLAHALLTRTLVMQTSLSDGLIPHSRLNSFIIACCEITRRNPCSRLACSTSSNNRLETLGVRRRSDSIGALSTPSVGAAPVDPLTSFSCVVHPTGRRVLHDCPERIAGDPEPLRFGTYDWSSFGLRRWRYTLRSCLRGLRCTTRHHANRRGREVRAMRSCRK